jgi:hypothetical protein
MIKLYQNLIFKSKRAKGSLYEAKLGTWIFLQTGSPYGANYAKTLLEDAIFVIIQTVNPGNGKVHF